MGSKNSTTSTLLTLAAGVVVGVLIAPASGRETRRKLMDQSGSAKDTLHFLVMEAGDLVDQLRSFLGSFSNGGSYANERDEIHGGRSESRASSYQNS